MVKKIIIIICIGYASKYICISTLLRIIISIEYASIYCISIDIICIECCCFCVFLNKINILMVHNRYMHNKKIKK